MVSGLFTATSQRLISDPEVTIRSPFAHNQSKRYVTGRAQKVVTLGASHRTKTERPLLQDLTGEQKCLVSGG